MRAELNAVLPQGYVADIGERCHPVIVELRREESSTTYIKIRSLPNYERVVTVIELLSPVNKARGEGDRESYLRKQQELLQSGTNLLEIDLQRAGTPTVAVYAESLYPKPDWDYIVCLHRAGQVARFETWQIRLQDRLPRVAVPLEEDISDVTLDLQTVFNRNYEEGAYANQIDYRSEPFPPLTPDQATWVNT